MADEKRDTAIRSKCKVEITECIYVDFTGSKWQDDGVVHKFMRWCLDNDILSIRTAGTVGPGVYAHCHRNKHKEKIIEFFEDEGIDVTVYST